MQQVIKQEDINRAMSFDGYLAFTKAIIQSDSPVGKYVKESTLRYTRLNLEQMERVIEHMTLQQKLYNLVSELKKNLVWLVLSEPWCGDAAWGVPALYIISTASDKIDFRILLRDENPDIIKAYQTDGSNSIPKLICLRAEDLKEMGVWGPRPAELQKLVKEHKNSSLIDYTEKLRQVNQWYLNDMTKSIQDEVTELVKKWKQ